MKILNAFIIGAVAILFTGILFYSANTLYDNPNNDCYSKYDYPRAIDENYNSPEYKANMEEYNNKMEACQEEYESILEVNNNYKQIGIAIIGIIIVGLLIFFKIKPIVAQGLFFGVLLSNIISAIAYYSYASFIGVILFALLFIEVIWHIVKRF